MKHIILWLAAASMLVGLPSGSQSAQLEGFSNQPVMPQSRARRIATSLDGWTMKNGERPKAIGIARDCMSASSYIMQRGTGQYGINRRDASYDFLGFGQWCCYRQGNEQWAAGRAATKENRISGKIWHRRI